MLREDTYRALVPNAAPHKRTYSDQPSFDALFHSRSSTESSLSFRTAIPGLNKPSLVSSYEGEIQRILLSFPPFAVREPAYVAAYQSLIKELRPGTSFIVVCVSDDEQTIKGWFTAAGHTEASVTFANMPPFAQFTDWAEDAYVGVQDQADGSTFLVEPWEFRRSGDALIADAVQNYTGNVSASQAPVMFQGGNCLVAKDHWFLGRDYYLDTVNLLSGPRPPVRAPSGMSEEDFITDLYKTYLDADRSAVLLGDTTPIRIPPFIGSQTDGTFFLDIASGGVGAFQPIFHIDMLMSLIGEVDGAFHVMVGDPDLADSILGRTSPYSLATSYANIANQLEQHGYVVHRNPLVHWDSLGQTLRLSDIEGIANGPPPDQALMSAVTQLKGLGASAASNVTVREWHHITWNNCLVENSPTVGKHVYLPTFGYGSQSSLAVVDTKMKELWESLGFTAHMLGDFNSFAERQGVVHCIKKYVDRERVHLGS